MKIISIGCNCNVRTFLNNNNFTTEAYPFDWIWTNIDFVIKTFETDYFDFTECEKLNGMFCSSNKHTYIHNDNCKGGDETICSGLSLHDGFFKSQEDYVSNIPIINEKYKRRFKRLYDVLNSSADIFLIRKVIQKQEYNPVKSIFETDEKINYLSEILSKKFKSNITICVIDDENFLNRNSTKDNIKIFNDYNELLLFLNNSTK
jgi:hypothetical protein